MTGADGYRRSQWMLIAAVLACVAAAALPLVADLGRQQQFAIFLFVRQDMAVVPLVLILSILRPSPAPDAGDRWRWIAASRWLLPVVLIALVIVCRIGHHVVFVDRDMTRDEQMAGFDGYIFAHGRLSWPLAPGWRPIADALNRSFMLPVAGSVAWVSAYLPVNALIQGVFGRFASPLLVAAGAAALWRIATRLWPGDTTTRAVVLLLYVGSAQIVLTGMTTYAMTGHLALDLVWLALFLRGGRAGHGGAIVVGALATGLHQPIFHPLFALPFLGLLAARRQWRTLGIYVVGYGAIGLFWLFWPGWLSQHAAGGVVFHGPVAVSFTARVVALLDGVGPVASIWFMALNLLRLATWQHFALLPLAVFGIAAAWRGDGMVRALAIGVVLPIVMAGILLPYQAHGWGYRYMHGVLGNLCLLGGYGWRAARERGVGLGRILLLASVASLLMLPVRARMAHGFAAPYAEIDRAARATGAPLIVVADDAAPFAADLVINRPDLAPPVWLQRTSLTQAQFATLCRRVPNLLTIDRAALAPVRAAFNKTLDPRIPPGPRCPPLR